MSMQTQEKALNLNIRIDPERRSTIKLAAETTGQSVSDFVRDAATREAENTLLDRTTLSLSEEEWDKFIAALDAPPQENPRLSDLMSRKPLWEK